MTGPVLVTGATGFIGSYLVPQLLDEGIPVRVLVRNPRLLPPAVRARVEVFVADLRDRDAMCRAIEGTDTILHLAACARAWMRDREAYGAINVCAVESLLEAARCADVRRFVHVSTILTLPPFRPAPIRGEALRPSPYERTKREGEQLVEQYAASGRHAVIVHPTRVYGPGPLTDANGVTRAAALYLQGRLRVRLSDGGVQANYVYVDDVATGIRLAAERARPGTHYVLGGENASFEQFLDLVAEIGGVHRRTVPLAPALALAVGHAAEGWGHLGGLAPITARWVRTFLEDRRTDGTPALRDLGYRPRSLRAGLEATIRWLRDEKRRAAA